MAVPRLTYVASALPLRAKYAVFTSCKLKTCIEICSMCRKQLLISFCRHFSRSENNDSLHFLQNLQGQKIKGGNTSTTFQPARGFHRKTGEYIVSKLNLHASTDTWINTFHQNNKISVCCLHSVQPDSDKSDKLDQKLSRTSSQEKVILTDVSFQKEDGQPSLFRKEDVRTIPNLLTTLRIAVTPVIGFLIINRLFEWALGIFIVAGISDVLDGYIARNFKNQTSALGTALDPLADKVLISMMYLTLTLAGLLPVPLTCLVIGRDVLLVSAFFYMRYRTLPPPKTISRYFDVTRSTAKVYPSMLGKVNTGLQLSLVAFTLAAPVFGFLNHPFLQGLWYLTAATTIGSGVSYIQSKNEHIKVYSSSAKKQL
ncbi:hypothetical protein CHS0354_007406 [Potamilus streckersoni]|uniref:cardiolipin synthase (CMP-forming) n=1 Tax=Potamilus streckersoni TaxID=2493646 RepID=A0AAE0SRR5_9BIVA|nr:hypothetical protein CHS0354_007406 [Potamilus streckersoni]